LGTPGDQLVKVPPGSGTLPPGSSSRAARIAMLSRWVGEIPTVSPDGLVVDGSRSASAKVFWSGIVSRPSPRRTAA
jgi:hypothetical protein